MVRRGDPDPLLLQTVTERLARLLAETAPRRAEDERDAAPEPTGAGSPVAGASLPEVREDDLTAARRFQRTHVGVVAALLLLGLLLAGWSLVRARPVALATPAAVSVSPPAGPVPAPTAASVTAPAATAGAATAAPEVVVHVLGAVQRPGLVELPVPARVQDAVDAAGGFTAAADSGDLNLAQPLTDGQQVVIGTGADPEGEVRGSGGPAAEARDGTGGGAAGPATGDVLDLNQADVVQLEELPGVGPVTAAKILAWREEHGRFSRVEELQEVAGIGPKTYAEIAPHVRV